MFRSRRLTRRATVAAVDATAAAAREASVEAERLNRQREATNSANQRKQQRVASWLGVAGFFVALVGVPLVGWQNYLLSEQTRLEGPVLSGTIQVIDATLFERLFDVGAKPEVVFSKGPVAAASSVQARRLRVEIVNAGRAVGAVTGAVVRYKNDWIPAEKLYCSAKNDPVAVDGNDPQLVDCDLPVMVQPGAIKVIIFDIPSVRAGCTSLDDYSPQELVVSMSTSSGEQVSLPTGVQMSMLAPCDVGN